MDVYASNADSAAQKRYPLPSVTRPRVVKTMAGEFRVIDGVVQVRGNSKAPWTEACVLTSNNVEKVADLLANPTEEVEADA